MTQLRTNSSVLGKLKHALTNTSAVVTAVSSPMPSTPSAPHNTIRTRPVAYTIAYSPCALRPTDPVPRGQLWRTGPRSAWVKPRLDGTRRLPLQEVLACMLWRCHAHSSGTLHGTLHGKAMEQTPNPARRPTQPDAQ